MKDVIIAYGSALGIVVGSTYMLTQLPDSIIVPVFSALLLALGLEFTIIICFLISILISDPKND